MEIKPVKDLGNGRTELVYSKKLPKAKYLDRHFSVPTEKQDEFVSDFKKFTRTSNILGWAGTAVATFAGIWLGGKISQKTILSWAGGVAGGLAFAIGAINIAARSIYKKQQQLFDKYDAKEMVYLREQAAENTDNAVKA